MPTYDYRCPNGHDFEHFYRKISEATSQLACPVCGAVAERRVSGGAGLVFKGSGFYLTDYGKNAHRTSGPESAPSESKSESKSESSGDSKPSTSGDGAKGATGSTSSSKNESATPAAKSETKSTDAKPSSKSKGSDTQ